MTGDEERDEREYENEGEVWAELEALESLDKKWCLKHRQREGCLAEDDFRRMRCSVDREINSEVGEFNITKELEVENQEGRDGLEKEVEAF